MVMNPRLKFIAICIISSLGVSSRASELTWHSSEVEMKSWLKTQVGDWVLYHVSHSSDHNYEMIRCIASHEGQRFYQVYRFRDRVHLSTSNIQQYVIPDTIDTALEADHINGLTEQLVIDGKIISSVSSVFGDVTRLESEMIPCGGGVREYQNGDMIRSLAKWGTGRAGRREPPRETPRIVIDFRDPEMEDIALMRNNSPDDSTRQAERVFSAGSRERSQVNQEPVPSIVARSLDDFNGWSGRTVIRTDRNDYWLQDDDHKDDSFAYTPRIALYEMGSVWYLRIENDRRLVRVRRLDIEFLDRLTDSFSGWDGYTKVSMRTGHMWSQDDDQRVICVIINPIGAVYSENGRYWMIVNNLSPVRVNLVR